MYDRDYTFLDIIFITDRHHYIHWEIYLKARITIVNIMLSAHKQYTVEYYYNAITSPMSVGLCGKCSVVFLVYETHKNV